MLLVESGSSFFLVFIELPGKLVRRALEEDAKNDQGVDCYSAIIYVNDYLACLNSSSNLVAIANLCFLLPCRERLCSRMPITQNGRMAPMSGAWR
jgi:hypothetical protein